MIFTVIREMFVAEAKNLTRTKAEQEKINRNLRVKGYSLVLFSQSK